MLNSPLRDWSLITGGGGGYKTGGGQVKFYPYKKRGGGAERGLAMLKAGATKSFEVVLTQELKVVAIVIGMGCKMFPPFKKGEGAKSFTLSRGRVQKDLQFSHIL